MSVSHGRSDEFSARCECVKYSICALNNMTKDFRTMDNNNFNDFSDTGELLGNTQVPPYIPQQKITLFCKAHKSSLLPPPSLPKRTSHLHS